MKGTLQERAKAMVDELASKGIDQVQIAKAAKVSKGTVNQWLTGDIKSVKMAYALGIERQFGYNHRWLVMGESPKLVSEREQAAQQTERDAWPFSISFDQYERLDSNKKAQLNDKVVSFIEGALPIEPSKRPSSASA